MSTIPDGIADSISWINARLAAWNADPTAIGLTAADVAELVVRTSEAQQRLLAADQARAASKGATISLHSGVADMREFAQAQLNRIRAFARLADEPALVYQAADIPAPAQPSPVPAPGTPYDFRITLLQGGVLGLGFKCDNPGRSGGVTYIVERSLSGQQGPYSYLTTVGERSFEDATIPTGTALAVYKITARRSTLPGSPAYFAVQFGAANQVTALGEWAGQEAGGGDGGDGPAGQSQEDAA